MYLKGDGVLIQNCLRADVSVKITRNEFNKWITVNSNVYKCTITILCSVFHLLVICLQYSSEITLFLKLFLWSFYVFNDKTMFLNQFLAVLDVVHNTRTATPIVQLQSSKSAWFIRIKSHGLDLGKADFKNFLWFIPSLFVKGRYIEARTVQKPDALTFINTPCPVYFLVLYPIFAHSRSHQARIGSTNLEENWISVHLLPSRVLVFPSESTLIMAYPLKEKPGTVCPRNLVHVF